MFERLRNLLGLATPGAPDDPTAGPYTGVPEEDALLCLLEAVPKNSFTSAAEMRKLDGADAVFKLDPEGTLRMQRVLGAWVVWRRERFAVHRAAGGGVLPAEGGPIGQLVMKTYNLPDAWGALLRKKMPATEEDVDVWIEALSSAPTFVNNYSLPVSSLITALERAAKDRDLTAAQLGALAACAARHREGDVRSSTVAKLVARVEALAGTVPETDAPRVLLEPSDAFAVRLLGELEDMPEAQHLAWQRLLAHAQGASGSKPSKKWSKAGGDLLDGVGHDDFVRVLAGLVPLLDKAPVEAREVPRWGPDPNLLWHGPHEELLKGLTWLTPLVGGAEVARMVGAIARSAYKKVPQRGPRATSVGNACVYALSAMPGEDGLAELAYLKVRARQRNVQKLIGAAFDRVAERLQVPRDAVEEMGVPAYGMSEPGLRVEVLGEHRAELRVVASTRTELRFFKTDATDGSKPIKSVPAAVKRDHPDEVKELKSAAKDIQKMMSAQRERIDNLVVQDRDWSLSTWRERYLDHALVGWIARRLIWRFQQGDTIHEGLWADGALRDAAGAALDLDDDTLVSLWHPLHTDTDGVIAWRARVEALGLVQPFKQAHREVYVLTDAERTTRVYSNRFAAHVIRQHQYHALCEARGWRDSLRLMVDDTVPATRKDLPAYGLRAELWVEGIGHDYDADCNEAGTFLRLVTDQVRFYALDAAEHAFHATGGRYGDAGDPVPLEDLPPVVMSEVFRDCDLFVGVASVGNDPTWEDGGPDGRFVDYWQRYAFGDLSTSAAERRVTIERLLPRLKIADRCEVRDRFLVVRGDRRTYKIHLGSSNILMEPNDQYLCIVQGRGGTAPEVYLPFEGDRTLAVILSKAFLLAADKKIEDATINSQIGA